jgi:hypothetical protein
MSVSFYVGDVLIQSGSAISIAGLPAATTSVAGIVQLNDTTSSTSTTQAATANAVKAAYDLAASGGAAATATTLGTVYGRDDAARDSLGAGQNALAAATGAATLNTAVGRSTFCALTTGIRNTAIGAATGRALTTGGRNTLVGAAVGCALTTTGENTFVGHNTGAANTGAQNTFVGSAAGDLTVATSCGVAIGWNALGAAATQSGTTAIGACALNALTTGACNVALGFQAGAVLTTGASNTLIGYTAGLDITTGSSNTIIGDVSGTAALANNLILAAGATTKLQVNENGALGVGSTPSYGTSGQILVSAGTGAAPTWTSSGTATANYGSFVRTTTQTNTGGASGNAVSYDTVSSANNFSVVSGSRITAAVAGTYQILASLQVQKTDAGTDDLNFWVKKNGVNEPNSAYNLTLVGSGAAQLGYINWVVTLAAGGYVELWWYSLDVNARLLADPAVAPYPAVPASGFIIHPMGA